MTSIESQRFKMKIQKQNDYKAETALLNFNHQSIQTLIHQKKWRELPEKERINQIYLYVRDEILFGYNDKDEINASQVIKDGIGQCNTKSTLLMALLRAVDIPCRFHGFTIDKALQKGAFSAVWHKLAPKNIIHSWVEVNYKNQWYNLEGVILDKRYLNKLQKKFKSRNINFCGYGAYTEDLNNPQLDWDENDTYIQKLGINQDFGLFDCPDSFYIKHQQDISFMKRLIFKRFVKKSNNKNVARIRNAK